MADTGAPFRRIAAHIAGQIDSGELRPGDRVPSTRAITQRWGVAMATATKVIAMLREQGLVETTPGSGTVVRPRGAVRPQLGQPPPHEPELTRERVVRAAMTIADTEGLAALSMRRVATSLGVATMSLYRHVVGKEELTVLMVDTAAGDFPFPQRRPPGWRANTEFAARLLWTMFRRHPWAAELMSMTRPQLMPNLLGYSEWTLGPLRELGLDVNTMMFFHLTVFGHVRSTAMNLHSETQAEQDTGLTADEWVETQEPALRDLVASGRYPTFEYVVGQPFNFDLNTLFEFGLRRLLDGFEVLLRQRARRR
jgi:DNA-binding transcriptional regulator YhcF (GntR family)